MYAPIAVNSIPRWAGDIGEHILNRGGRARIVVMDPSSSGLNAFEDHVNLAGAASVAGLHTTLSVLERMTSLGDCRYRLLQFNPGFSITIVDPKSKRGRLIVEFHGFRDYNVNSRMHIEIHRSDSLHWFEYWTQRFEAIWDAAREPDEIAT